MAGLVDLPENIQTALTDKQTRSAPGDWNNPYWGSNEFVSVSTGQQVFFKKYESSYRFTPKDTIYDRSLSGQEKNPFHSAIAYIQNLQERVNEVAEGPFDNSPRGDLPPASKLRDSLREMIFDYVLQARNQQSTLAGSPK